MTKIVWGAVGERFYEAGTDRGVLYIDGEIGVPWNGLTGVKEAPSGGDPQPFYIDGFKHINVASESEFEATIEAFSAPKLFDRCEGTRALQNGLFVTQQPKKSFGFSYRTLIGNDLKGIDRGYKVHMVYNALAGASDRSNASISNQAAPVQLSWPITTKPPRATGIRPTAHLIVDSRYTTPSLLSSLEDILYGSSVLDSRLPSVTEVLGMFGV